MRQMDNMNNMIYYTIDEIAFIFFYKAAHNIVLYVNLFSILLLIIKVFGQ